MPCRPRLSIAAINRRTQSCSRSRRSGSPEQHATIPGQREVILNERIHQRTNILDDRTAHRPPHIRLTEQIELRAYTTVELSRYLLQYFRDGAGIAGAEAGVDSSFAANWACL